MGFSWKKIIWLVITPLLAFGFQVFPQANTWNINSSSVAASKLFIVYSNGSTVLTNNIPAGDVLSGTATVTVQQIMNSIINDFNAINGTFLTLADSSDSDYASNSTNRKITIELASVSGTSGGEAQGQLEGGKMVGCSIVVPPSTFNNAKSLTAAITHEIGHCIGLDHAMDTTNSVMSYYKSENTIRLQLDDKMGIVYLYPADRALGKEDPTLGFACSRR